MSLIQYYAMPGLKYRHQTIDRSARANDAIIEICNYFNTTPEKIKERNRKREVVEIRNIVMHFLKTNLNMTLSSIGRLFKLDHTSVIHAIRRCNDLMQTDPVFLKQVQEVDNIVY